MVFFYKFPDSEGFEKVERNYLPFRVLEGIDQVDDSFALHIHCMRDNSGETGDLVKIMELDADLAEGQEVWLVGKEGNICY